MPHRFCAICGKEINENAPHFGMCTACYLKENPLFELPKKFDLRICLDCYRYSIKEIWIKPGNSDFLAVIKEATHELLLNPLNKNQKLTFSIEIDQNSLIFSSKDLITALEMKIKGSIRDNSLIFNEYILKLLIRYELCNNCLNVRSGSYFTSILQLRVKNPSYFDFLKNVIDEINNFIKEEFNEDDKQYVSKMVDQKNGVDMYLSTIELMNHIISHLKPKYNYILKRSKKLVGRDRQKGKGIYRLKALMKFLPIKKNDIVKIKNEEFVVEQILKNDVLLKNKKGEKLNKSFEYFFND